MIAGSSGFSSLWVVPFRLSTSSATPRPDRPSCLTAKRSGDARLAKTPTSTVQTRFEAVIRSVRKNARPSSGGTLPALSGANMELTCCRPFYMFFTEPIVLWLSLLSGFSDALIFTFLEGFKPVYEQWGFGIIQLGLAFIPILIGYFLAYLSYMPSIMKFRRKRKQNPGSVAPEARLWWLLFLAPLEFLGMMGFAWTSLGPQYGIPWIAPMIYTTLVAMANVGLQLLVVNDESLTLHQYAIYQSSIDYQTAAYGPYAASATGGNDLARDFMAGVAALYSTPLYKNIPGRPVQYASTLLSCLAVVVTIPIYIVYWKGPEIRAKSKFAQSLDKTREERTEKRRKSSLAGLQGEKEGREHLERV